MQRRAGLAAAAAAATASSEAPPAPPPTAQGLHPGHEGAAARRQQQAPRAPPSPACGAGTSVHEVSDLSHVSQVRIPTVMRELMNIGGVEATGSSRSRAEDSEARAQVAG